MTDEQIAFLERSLAAGYRLVHYNGETYEPISHITHNHREAWEDESVPGKPVAWLAGKLNHCISLYVVDITEFGFVTRLTEEGSEGKN